MRTRTMFALTAAAALTLSACGGGGDPLTQEQVSQALLTEDDFPLEGYTAGTVEEGSTDDAESTAGSEDLLEGFPGADQLSQECQDALTAVASMDVNSGAQAKVEFTGSGDDSPMGPPTVQLVVASMEGEDNPLDAVDQLNSECEELEIEEGGVSMKMSFNEIEGDAQGTKIAVEAMGQSMEVIFAGREDGGTYSVVTGTGVGDDEVIQVLDAQDEKIDEV